MSDLPSLLFVFIKNLELDAKIDLSTTWTTSLPPSLAAWSVHPSQVAPGTCTGGIFFTSATIWWNRGRPAMAMLMVPRGRNRNWNRDRGRGSMCRTPGAADAASTEGRGEMGKEMPLGLPSVCALCGGGVRDGLVFGVSFPWCLYDWGREREMGGRRLAKCLILDEAWRMQAGWTYQLRLTTGGRGDGYFPLTGGTNDPFRLYHDMTLARLFLICFFLLWSVECI